MSSPFPWVCVKGECVPSHQACVSVFDRSFLYGDGLFETVPVINRTPFRWKAHWRRLLHGAQSLNLTAPATEREVLHSLNFLLEKNGLEQAVARVHWSRGRGGRGYSTIGSNSPLWVLSLHPLPEWNLDFPASWKLVASSLRLPARQPFWNMKHANRLLNVLATSEAQQQGADDALLLNTQGTVVESSGANVFWFEEQGLATPTLESGALHGVTRDIILNIVEQQGIPCQELDIQLKELQSKTGLFLTQSTRGIIAIHELDGVPMASDPRLKPLWAQYRQLVGRECGIASEDQKVQSKRLYD